MALYAGSPMDLHRNLGVHQSDSVRGMIYGGALQKGVPSSHNKMATHTGRPHKAMLIQTSLYVIVATVMLVCALIHLFIYRRRRKAKKKKHTYENTKPTKSGRCFLVEPKLFERKSKNSPAKKDDVDVELPPYSEPGKALCYSIVNITDEVSTLQHLNSIGKSEPDLRKSANFYESIEIVPETCMKKGFASNAKNKANEATTKIKKFGANKKSQLQRTFQSLTNLCVTNVDSCEDLTHVSKGRKDSSKCDYNRLTSPSSKMGRSIGNIYDTLSRQNPWKLAERNNGRYEDVEVRMGFEEKPMTEKQRRRYQSISVPKFLPEKGQYKEGRFPLAGLAGCKVPQWQFSRIARQTNSKDYEHVRLNKPKGKSSSGHKPKVAPKNFAPVYFTLDPSINRISDRTAFDYL